MRRHARVILAAAQTNEMPLIGPIWTRSTVVGYWLTPAPQGSGSFHAVFFVEKYGYPDGTELGAQAAGQPGRNDETDYQTGDQ